MDRWVEWVVHLSLWAALVLWLLFLVGASLWAGWGLLLRFLTWACSLHHHRGHLD